MNYLQSDETSLEFRIRGTSTSTDEVPKPLTAGSDDSAVKLALNRQIDSGLLRDLISDGKDGSLGRSNGSLGTPKGDCGRGAAFLILLKVDLSASRVLNFIDGSAAATEDASNRASRNSELGGVIVFLLNLQSLERTLRQNETN